MVRTVAIIAVFLVIAALTGLWIVSRGGNEDQFAQCRQGQVAGGTAAIGGPFELVSETGETVTDEYVLTEPSLIYFGYTFCPDVCPTTLNDLTDTMESLGKKADDIQVIMVSVDPERDTPEIMSQYVDYFGDDNLGITGSLEEVRKLTGGLGIYFEKQSADGDDYVVDHSAAVLVIDPNGDFHALFSGPHVVENYVYDLPIIMGDN